MGEARSLGKAKGLGEASSAYCPGSYLIGA